MLNLPNILTLIRILLIPVFVGLFYYPSLRTNLLAAIVFIIAALTDFIDGYLARKLQQTTKFGAFLDPVADKIIVCTALVLIVEYYSVHVEEFFPHINLCVTLPSIVIIAREIVVSALREWMAEIGQRARVAVNWVGKWKTAIQMIAIAGLIWRYNDIMIYAALFMLQVATVLTIMSMVMYLKVGLAHMFEDQAEKKAVEAPKVAGSSVKDKVTLAKDADNLDKTANASVKTVNTPAQDAAVAVVNTTDSNVAKDEESQDKAIVVSDKAKEAQFETNTVESKVESIEQSSSSDADNGEQDSANDENKTQNSVKKPSI